MEPPSVDLARAMHWVGGDRRLLGELVAIFVEEAPGRLAELRRAAAARDAGLRMGFGTDLLGELHEQQSRELGIRAQVLAPAEVLRSATLVNAEILNRTGELGVVAPGAKADLLVVDGDPLRDLSRLEGQGKYLDVVMKDGTFFANRLAP